ncbi:uncharacterized protein LOC118349840 [Juglans regia]|uniref:Uncharacterized protein LOC118349840 n=1 Tax=Juglans regia TaxID=51240 RepID=A0A6P9EW06_JUGRE|nr:uncharacterized protein LOC118349840 [Juglans regia]
MVPVGSVNNIKQLANTLGCKVASLPMEYLGLPLGAASRAISISDTMIEKIERRLAGWKRLYLLPKGGRITLIKMADLMEISGEQVQWNINFSRVAQDGSG